MEKNMRKYMLAGAAVVLPLTVTLLVLWFIFGLLDGWVRRIIFSLTGQYIYGAGVIITVLILLVVGFLATNYIGRRIINYWESLFFRIPMVNVIYKTTKQIVEVVGGRDSRPFRQTVLVEYPRRGLYTVAFVTGEVKVKEESGLRDLVCVFICTTPNPTTGFLILVPREDVIYLSNSVEDGIRLLLSGGIVGSFRDGEEGIILHRENSPNK